MLLLAGGLFAQDDNEAEREREKAEKVARSSYRTRLKRPINGVIFEPDSLQNVPDSMGILRFTRGVHFADSLKSGRFDSAILAMQTIDHGKKVTFNITAILTTLIKTQHTIAGDRESFGILAWGCVCCWCSCITGRRFPSNSSCA